ncbi:MAG: DUF4988 domain-containing protein [Candidatus Azobacteroides sp.]|nr:DUF4988 domain-containing protein [Candidatus Azobacteroides sp.]
MKKITYTILFSLIFLSCQNEDWKDEINELRNELNNQKKIIEALQEGILINNIKKSDNGGYIIEFSNNTSISISDGKTPLIVIGENGNWYIDAVDTGVSAIGEDGKDGINGVDGIDGKDGITPDIKIGDNGNWFINDNDTGILAQGSKGENAPKITSIIQQGTHVVFNFNDGTSISLQLNKRKIPCWGDSLTAVGGYLQQLQQLLGDEYVVINGGVIAENSLCIAGRQGGCPVYLENPVTLPADGSEFIMGDINTSNIRIMDVDGILKNASLLRIGSASTVNPVTVEGIECTISWTGSEYSDPDGKYTIRRNIPAEENYTTIPNTPLFTNGMKMYRNPHAMIIWIGTNGGYNDIESFVAQHKKMIEFANTGNYICIGLHSGTAESGKELEALMQKEFGMRYLNWREYCVTRALRDAGITPTEADIAAMEKGACPPSLLRDNVHLNEVADKLLGNLIYERFFLLGFL